MDDMNHDRPSRDMVSDSSGNAIASTAAGAKLAWSTPTLTRLSGKETDGGFTFAQYESLGGALAAS